MFSEAWCSVMQQKSFMCDTWGGVIGEVMDQGDHGMESWTWTIRTMMDT